MANVSKEGIKADLEWMKRMGIGGFSPEARGFPGAGMEGRIQIRSYSGR